MDILEKTIAYSPPLVYSKIEGIKSVDGTEAEGWIITIGGTPKQMMSRGPEFTYKRLIAASKLAKKLGAQIMGLGAFTKVIGDAGITVSKHSPIPITTGNSYSSSAALWAAADAMKRLGLVTILKGKEKLKAKSLIVGATGAIGSVSSRLLAMVFDEIILCGRNEQKLAVLKRSINQENPETRIITTVDADSHLPDADMVVTATSGAGKKILDITKVKPGCVITDVARPLDLKPEDVAKRPDVLYIESGEIEVPVDGQLIMRDINLPKNVVFACMAETIVLALEGRFEEFTIGRNIEWKKVKEIYKLGLKHGMKLAAISGVNGVYTKQDIDKIRELALRERK
jgi:predicted amino acid dehydrogenase|tara:strand:+ start:139 stop:1164 length:1026 start_codon:yes stop_codon:yes gene_type:complete